VKIFQPNTSILLTINGPFTKLQF